MKFIQAFLPKKALLVTIMTCLALVFGFAHQASAVDWWVTVDGTYDAAGPGCSGTDSCDDSIQDAIDAAAATPDTVIVCPGSYTECIDMKSGVNVINSGGSKPIINCTGSFDSTFEFYPLSASMTCNIDGLEIRHTSGTGAGILIDGTSYSVTTTISNCNIHDIYNSGGIAMDGDVDVTIEDNTINDCARAGIGMSGEPEDSGALSSGSSVTIEGNTIGAASPNQNQEAGIFIQGPDSVSATVNIGDGTAGNSNTVQYNAESGVRVEDITDLTIDNNTVQNNTKAGIFLVDVGADGDEAIVRNNTIQSNSKAGINIGGLSYLTVGPTNTISSNSTDGISFNMTDVDVGGGVSKASSGPVTITGNTNINNNSFSGIGIIDPITNTVTITENDIYSNSRGGIRIQDACTLVITENTVRNHVYGGIHTGGGLVVGLPQADPGGFSGTNGSANLTIGQNKIYGNGQNGFGGGIDVRHADGTIYNNLVYENHMGGIRFGDWIDEIINNTVADNGNDGDEQGGGIIYDDISAGDAMNDPPEGALPDPTAILIRNNIMAFNETTGLRVGRMPTNVTSCPGNPDRDDPNTGDKYRDYNLVYANNGTGATDCDWSVPGSLVMSCANKQYGGCASAFDGTWPDLFYPNDMIADPLFVNRALDDYTLGGSSPAKLAGDDDLDLGAYGGGDPIP